MHDERARQAPTSQRNKNPDSLYIALKDAPGAGSREIVAGLVVDLDANGDVVGFAIDQASGKLDLTRIETFALPAVSAAE
ncbi:DUF2283 domain-containing protein [Tardiphaga sp. 604_B6_N1_1]|uniref:DUF2283 domain-containing protein n=1 Tax=Tardiphaga sp. 604_B6_N1_1 TaxID=3240779 RepID=UPI003F1F918D